MTGEGQWLLIYGGDPFNEKKPDLAVMARHIQALAQYISLLQHGEHVGWMHCAD